MRIRSAKWPEPTPWLTPALFGWHEVTFWQALGLLVLCRILFGGLGRHGGYRSSRTPEERERFRQGMRQRVGWGGRPGEGPDQPPTGPQPGQGPTIA